MTDDALPDSKEARIDWVIRAPDNAEMCRRYDLWAAQYDADLGTIDDYLAPQADAGAGTGLVGQALKAQGFTRLIAIDYSERMLAAARAKGIYDALHCCDLSQPTHLAADSFDAVISCGTTTQMPSASLREFVRITRPGGKIIFAVVRGAWEDHGYGAIFRDLEAAGRLALSHRGPPFQMMPTTEPDFLCEIWVMTRA